MVGEGKTKKRKKKRRKIRQENITVSHWLRYFQQISTIHFNHYFTFYSMLMVFFAILISLIIYTNTRLAGISILDYEIIPHPAGENTTRVVFGLQKHLGFVEWANWAIIVFLAIFLFVLSFFFSNNQRVLKAKVAENLQLAILSKKYPRLKNADNIEKTWNHFTKEIQSTKLLYRRKLLKKRNERPFDEWFKSNIDKPCNVANNQ